MKLLGDFHKCSLDDWHHITAWWFGACISGQRLPQVCDVVHPICACQQVATARVAKAQKAEIPCVDDPVSKLEDIGDKTSQKLLDVQSAAEAAGVCDVVFPDKSVVTGQSVLLYMLPLLPCAHESVRCQSTTSCATAYFGSTAWLHTAPWFCRLSCIA